MPTLTWNETRDRAVKFAHSWANAKHEEQDKQTFWNEFFECFGIPRKSVALFEKRVENLKGNYGFIDLFWPGKLLVEQKSRGASLDKAESQAFAYMEDLARAGRHDELPRYVILCDFARVALFDLEPEDPKGLPVYAKGKPYRRVEFPLSEFHKHVREFAFIRGDKPIKLDPEDDANFNATQLLADLHDALDGTGFSGHALERLLVRLLFCLFAEDTQIFDRPRCFTELIERTRQDGNDLGPLLQQLFQVLDTPVDIRQKNLDEDLAAFPYVNGGLFGEKIDIATFNSDHRNALLACCRFRWEKISPAVFGSLFQGIMDEKERRQAGAHYTSERDIMKLIRSLFLNDLERELNEALADRSTSRNKRLQDFQKKLRSLKFFDPACGCGNFLILAYRELRRLEKILLLALNTTKAGAIVQELDIRQLAQVDVDQFFGIEISEWPARIAEVGLWLTDHQCNVELADAMGQHFTRLPLKASPTILAPVNALRSDWKALLPPSDNVFVLGNPPFVGKHLMTDEQGEDIESVWNGADGIGVLDYVTGWYRKAAEYIRGTKANVAFVSTNSITQGEQVCALWPTLFQQFGIKIIFAHRTFAWVSEARGAAHVHVVIIGFANHDVSSKDIVDYDNSPTTPTSTVARNISPYLIEGKDTAVCSRSEPLSDVPPCEYGSKPVDGGNLILEEADRKPFIDENPSAKRFVRPLLCAEEYLSNIPRWCIWLVDAKPGEIKESAGLMKRIEAVRDFRLASKKVPTRDKATTPTLFAEIRQPAQNFLVIPQHTSQNRRYVPFGYFSPDNIVHNSCSFVGGATDFQFGILSSSIHMAWIRTICGRIKSDFRYSTRLVYNNFPWPENVPEKTHAAVEEMAQQVLAMRKQFADSTLSDLYDPLSMPPALSKAHADLDRAADRCYRKEPFASDRERVEHLFAMYERLTAPLLPEDDHGKRPRRKRV